jgi:Xaa-Pro aminopeptidase
MRVLPDQEYKERVVRLQAMLKEEGLDGLLAHSHEADFANVRYFSDYWPIFESTGVLIPQGGEPTLLIGPESEAFALDRSKIARVRKMIEYRESAEPDYPGLKVDTFPEVVAETFAQTPKKIGIAGYSMLPVPVYESIKAALPNTEFVNANNLLAELKMRKAENEIALLREGFRISAIAMDAVFAGIKAGMTELEVVGLAQGAMYANGAEYEAHPLYILSGPNSRHAISRPTHRVIQEGEVVQLNIGARVGGYSPSIGLPYLVGEVSEDVIKATRYGLDTHEKTIELMKPGVVASDIAKAIEEFMIAGGYGDNLLYGPCHGLGMLEVEAPWIEKGSDYRLEAGMTYQVDTFFQMDDYGFRWEQGVLITDDGAEKLAKWDLRSNWEKVCLKK